MAGDTNLSARNKRIEEQLSPVAATARRRLVRYAA
jgi:hypothetical protein